MVWKVDLEEVAKAADESVPKEVRHNPMQGLEGVQEQIEENREALKKGGKKKKASSSGSGPEALDPKAVPSSWNKKIGLDDKYKVGKKK